MNVRGRQPIAQLIFSRDSILSDQHFTVRKSAGRNLFDIDDVTRIGAIHPHLMPETIMFRTRAEQGRELHMLIDTTAVKSSSG